MKSNFVSDRVSPKLAVAFLCEFRKQYQPKPGIEIPKLPHDQVVRDYLDAARTVPHWDPRYRELIQQAQDLRAPKG